jgi:ATP-dependent DNA helicase RecG
MFKINYLKKVNKEIKKSIKRKVNKDKVNEFIRELPFELTADQNESINEIYDDLTSEYRMNRMLQGDVGSGKTIVGVIACYINFLAGYQSSLMAPTEILATQHFNSIKELLKFTDMKVELLTGSLKKKEKEDIYERLKDGKIDLLIGTHAIISEGVEFKNLGLVITDEQHRFGVNQRTNFKNKGAFADTLYMSATPIPRTFALTLYGDMDISNIKTKPIGRKDIETIVKSEKDLTKVYEMMREEVNKGYQVFVISPLIEDSETLDLTTVNNLKLKIDEYFDKKIKTSIMHGKLSKTDKDEIMEKFKEGKIDVLISTTVVEVGIDIRNATMMVIFDAERFGLATLHQLRGRIGRNELDCKCILIGDAKNKRLKVLTESNDGFYITEKDYEQRREGDLFGIKQSGDMTFKIADIKNDFKILMQTKEDSEEFLKENIKNGFENYEYYKELAKSIGNLD